MTHSRYVMRRGRPMRFETRDAPTTDPTTTTAPSADVPREPPPPPATPSIGPRPDVRTAADEMARATRALHDQLERSDQERTRMGTELGQTRETIERLQTRLSELETSFARPPSTQPTPGELDEIRVIRQRNFFQRAASLRFNPRALRDWSARELSIDSDDDWLDHFGVERRLMLASDDETGGIFAPPAVEAEIIRDIVEISPFRALARVTTINRRSMTVTRRTQTAAATWVGEVETNPETQNPKYTMDEIVAKKLHARADVSNEDLEDAVLVNLEAELRMEFSEQFALSEGEAFISGNGTTRPHGFLNDPDIGGVTSTASPAGSIEPDDLFALYFAIKTFYAQRAVWVLNRTLIQTIRTFQDGDNQYLWRPGLEDGSPPTILGRPYVEMPAMPDLSSGSESIAFGDWARGYRIIDRTGMSVFRDPYTDRDNDTTRFYARRRIGGQVVQPEAIKILTSSS